MASKRFLIVPVDSSAARMPLPGAVMATATLLSSARFIALSRILDSLPVPLFYPQNLDPRQRFALHPLEESAAGCGHVGQMVGHPGHVQGRDRVAAARDRDQPAGFG